MDRKELQEITGRLDKILEYLNVISKPESNAKRIVDGVIAVVTITGIVSVIDIVKDWLGG